MLAPPGVAAERIAMLRTSLAATFKDPAYLADCEKQRLECDAPVTGEQMQSILKRAYDTPEPVLKLKDVMPASYAELLNVRKILEKHFKDVQDIEFTIQEGKLFMLQTRNGKRTAAAALKISMDLYKEKLIDAEKAVLLNPADQFDQLLAPIFDAEEESKAD